MTKKTKKTASADPLDEVKDRARAVWEERREKGWRARTPIWVQYQASVGKYCARIMDMDVAGYGYSPSAAVEDLEFEVTRADLHVPPFVRAELTDSDVDEALSGIFQAYFELAKWEARLGFDLRGNPDSVLAFPWPPKGDPDSIVIGVSTGDGLMAIRELRRDGELWRVKKKLGKSASFSSARDAFIAAQLGEV